MLPAGQSDDEAAAAAHYWAIVVDYLVGAASWEQPGALVAWRATDPDAMASLSRLALARLGCLALQAQQPMTHEQLAAVLSSAGPAFVGVPLAAAEQLLPAERRLADQIWAATMRAISELLSRQDCPTALSMQQAWQAPAGSDMAAVLQLAASLPGQVPKRLPEGPARRAYACSLISSWHAVLRVLRHLLLGGAQRL